MKHPFQLSFVAAFLIATCISVDGSGRRRGGIKEVSVGVTVDSIDRQLIEDQGGEENLLVKAALTVGDLAILRDQPRFEGKSDIVIRGEIENTRRNFSRSAYLLGKTYPQYRSNIETQVKGDAVSLGFAPRYYPGRFEVVADGRPQVHVEDLNFLQFSTENLGISHPDLFQMGIDLGKASYLVQAEFSASNTDDPFEAMVERHDVQATAASIELFGINSMQGVIASIRDAGTVPAGVVGGDKHIGLAILSDFAGDPNGLQKNLDEWSYQLEGMKLNVGQRFQFETTMKLYAEYARDDEPFVEDIQRGLNQQRLFQYEMGALPGEPSSHWYTSEAARIEQNEGEDPQVIFSNMCYQQTPAGLESSAVSQLHTICTGHVNPEADFGMLGGIYFPEEGPPVARVVGFDLDPVSHALLWDTARICMETEEMAGGYTMNLNPFDGEYYALQFDRDIICWLRDLLAGLCPDSGEFLGYLAKSNPRLSLSGIYFPEVNTIVGSQFYSETVSHLGDPLPSSTREPDGEFVPASPWRLGDDLWRRPAIDGRFGVGSDYLPIVGSPGARFEVLDGDTSVATGYLSPFGRAVPELSWPVMPNSELWVSDVDNGLSSLPRLPEESLGEVPRIQVDDSFLNFGSLGLRLEASWEFRAAYETSNDLTGFERNRVNMDPFSRFGETQSKFDVSPISNGSGRAFVRGFTWPVGDPVGFPDSFTFVPGTTNIGHVGLNDDYLPYARYELVSPPSIPDDAFKFFGDGSFKLSYLTFDSQYQFSYRIRLGGRVSEDITATVLPDGTDLQDPEVYYRDDQVVLLEVYGLFLEPHLFFPLIQFSLRPPDACPNTHWHSPGYPTVRPVQFVSGSPAPGISADSDPFGCGYGKLENLPVATRLVDKVKYDAFINPTP